MRIGGNFKPINHTAPCLSWGCPEGSPAWHSQGIRLAPTPCSCLAACGCQERLLTLHPWLQPSCQVGAEGFFPWGEGWWGERSSPLQAAKQGSPAALRQEGLPRGHWCPCTRGPPGPPVSVCVCEVMPAWGVAWWWWGCRRG